MFSNLDDKNKQSIKRKIFFSNLNLTGLNVSITKKHRTWEDKKCVRIVIISNKTQKIKNDGIVESIVIGFKL